MLASPYFRKWVGLGGLIVLTLIWGCLTETKNETKFRFKLEDTLATFDSVEIAIVNRADSTKVVTLLFRGKLFNPGNVDSILVPSSYHEDSQMVRVRAWQFENQLGWEAFLKKKKDSTYVTRNDTLHPKAYSRELISLSTYDGTFVIWTKDYNPKLPNCSALIALNIDSVNLYPAPKDGRAVVLVENSVAVFGKGAYAHLPGKITNVPIKVTVNNVTNTYTLTLTKDSRAGPHIKSLVTNPNQWSPNFSVDSLNYTMTVSSVTDSLRFVDLQLLDVGSAIYLDTLLIPENTLPAPIPLKKGLNTFVFRIDFSPAMQIYTFNVTRL